MNITPTTTLQDAKEQLEANLTEGVTCPCCSRFAKRYRRKLHAEMGRYLVNVYKRDQFGTEWIHIREIMPGVVKASTDASYLVHYGLIECRGSEGGAGWYRTTPFGREFVEGKRMAKSHFFVYGGESQGFSGDYVSIKQVLGTKFDYAELMAGV